MKPSEKGFFFEKKMKILIKKAKVIDTNSPFHHQIVDILVNDGMIQEIGEISASADKELSGDNLCVSVGWMDMRVMSQDPGHETVEDLESLCNAAANGGFTEIATLPNTHPTVQTKESLAYFKRFAAGNVVSIHPLAAVTKNCEGKDFTEMYDLHKAGAVAFTDGEKPLWNADIFLKTLQYLHPIEALLINKPEEPTLSIFGQMHEGITSTLLGMKGISETTEEIMIMRDLKLLEYANLQSEQPILHFSTISTAQSVALIREAKAKGLPVSCDIAAHQLAFIDEDLMSFDTNLKVNPPFRTKEAIEALKAGLADGTIDVIVSDHNPQDEEAKKLEFDMAAFGIIGLQTAFAVANTFSNLSVEQLVDKLTNQPRKLLRQANPAIAVGEQANLTIFDPTQEWVLEEKDILSKSKNTPFVGKTLKGKALAVINNDRVNIRMSE